MPGDVVGVVVRLEDMLEPDAAVAREVQILVDLESRIDNRRRPGLLVADQVRGASEIVVGDLLEEHRALRCRRDRLGALRPRRPDVAAALAHLARHQARTDQ